MCDNCIALYKLLAFLTLSSACHLLMRHPEPLWHPIMSCIESHVVECLFFSSWMSTKGACVKVTCTIGTIVIKNN